MGISFQISLRPALYIAQSYLLRNDRIALRDGKKGDDILVNLTFGHRPFSPKKFKKNVISNPDERRGEKSLEIKHQKVEIPKNKHQKTIKFQAPSDK
ncbi:MAG: hypothetical protein PF448_00970 [Bacteroidales bacterium]|jgi:hypothetical protein|nr:hypothetical protein [Bacteroidales bacterium]